MPGSFQRTHELLATEPDEHMSKMKLHKVSAERHSSLRALRVAVRTLLIAGLLKMGFYFLFTPALLFFFNTSDMYRDVGIIY